MSVLHVLQSSGFKQAKLKFFNYKFCNIALSAFGRRVLLVKLERVLLVSGRAGHRVDESFLWRLETRAGTVARC